MASNTLEPTLDDIAKQLQKLREMVRSLHPDYQARILILAAIEQGISWRAVAHMPRWWHFSLGNQTRYFFETLPGGEPRFGLAVMGNKLATSQILRDAGLPTPNNELVRNPQHAAERAASYGWPLVVNPSIAAAAGEVDQYSQRQRVGCRLCQCRQIFHQCLNRIAARRA